MQATITGSAVNAMIQLPSDCREVHSVRIAYAGSNGEIYPLPPSRLADAETTDFPVGYVVVGNAL